MQNSKRASLLYLGGASASALLGLIGSILLTRLLPPQLYAKYGLLVTLGAAAVTLLSLGLDAAYVRFYYRHAQTQARWLRRCLLPSLLPLALLCLLLLLPCEPLIRLLLGEVPTRTCLALICLYVALLLLHRYAQATARMEERALRFALSQTAERAVFLVVALLAALWVEPSLLSLVAALSAGLLAALGVHLVRRRSCRERVEEAPVRMRELFAYGLPYMVNNFILLLIPTVERTLLRGLGSWEALGVYTAAAVFGMPALLLTGVLDSVWNPLMLRRCNDERTFRPLLHDAGLTVTAALCLLVALTVALRRVAVLLLGEDYRAAVVIAPAVLLSAGLGAVALILGAGINIRRKTLHHTLSALLQLGISTGLCLWLAPRHAEVGVAIAALGGALVGRVWRMVAGLRLYSTGRAEIKCALLLLLSTATALLSLWCKTALLDAALGALLLAGTCLTVVREGRALLARFAASRKEGEA